MYEYDGINFLGPRRAPPCSGSSLSRNGIPIARQVHCNYDK